ncbi:MAG: 50S ribosomal protein L7/L12 [Chlamydiales bacterium]
MSQEKLSQLVQELNQLPALELSKLKKLLEEEWGVTAAAPMMMAAGPVGAGPAAAEEAEEASEFRITLEEFAADKKISVIKVIREITGLGLKEAKELVESAPKAVKEGATKAEAEEIVKKLQDAGAKVSSKGM